MNWMGDWGRANLHRALGWLCYEFNKLAGPYSRIGIWNGTGALDNVRAVGRGEVDVALATPQGFIPLALDGRGIMRGESYPHLRALGHVPQHDRLVVAIRRDLDITSWDDLREQRPALRIAAGIDNGTNYMGYAAQSLMQAAGIPRDEFERWGGAYLEREEPLECTRLVLDGHADAIIQEAIMTHAWLDLAERIDLVFLPVEADARDRLHAELGWGSATLPQGYLRGIDREMEFMDFSHFLLLTTTDLPDDIAYALAWASIEGFGTLQRMYEHLPPERSPVSYPINPRLAAATPIPLHPGAERYFRDAGHL